MTVPDLARYVVDSGVGGSGREVNSHTFIGLGFMACLLTVIWLIRRSRA